MERWREILEKLHAELKKKKAFPAYIGEAPQGVVKCVITGHYYRISGDARYPTELLRIVDATLEEFFAALEWVTRGSKEHCSIFVGGFWVFIPEDKNDWPKE